jgi:hypothetical protein
LGDRRGHGNDPEAALQEKTVASFAPALNRLSLNTGKYRPYYHEKSVDECARSRHSAQP